MHAAIAVFWATFFVNQRGCPNRSLLKPLFYYLVENCKFMEMADEVPDADTSSRYMNKSDYWENFTTIDPGKLAGWIFSYEERGMRMKA